MELSSFDDVVSNISYARKRFSTSQDTLLVGLWGFFEKAAVGLTRLYKDKLDNCSDSQCLVETLHRIDSFYRISQEVLNCAQIQGSSLGYDCQRLVLRDLLLPADNSAKFQEGQPITDLHGYEVYSSILHPYLGYDETTISHRHRKRQRQQNRCQQKEKQDGRSHCHRCCHRRGRARRPPVKRCRLHDVMKIKKMINEGYDFSQASKDTSSYDVINFSSPVAKFGINSHRVKQGSPACTVKSPGFPSETVAKLLKEAGVVLSPCDKHHERIFHQTGNLLRSPPPLLSSRKRLFDSIRLSEDNSTDPAFIDAVHLSNLISPMSKFTLDSSVPSSTKRNRRDSFTSNTSQELPFKNL